MFICAAAVDNINPKDYSYSKHNIKKHLIKCGGKIVALSFNTIIL